MKTSVIIKLLETIKEEDDKFIKEREKTESTFATYCCECHANKGTALYPFWHQNRRSLCTSCGAEYSELLKSIGAWDY